MRETLLDGLVPLARVRVRERADLDLFVVVLLALLLTKQLLSLGLSNCFLFLCLQNRSRALGLVNDSKLLSNSLSLLSCELLLAFSCCSSFDGLALYSQHRLLLLEQRLEERRHLNHTHAYEGQW